MKAGQFYFHFAIVIGLFFVIPLSADYLLIGFGFCAVIWFHCHSLIRQAIDELNKELKDLKNKT